MHALVGCNNAGKSTILHAIDLLFSPSTRKLNEESFWNRDTSKEIRVEGIFHDLNSWEKEKLSPYLRSDGSFQLARKVKWLGGEVGDSTKTDEDDGENGVQLETMYCRPAPNVEWLRDDLVSGEKITEWWAIKTDLVIHGQSFSAFVDDKKPKVGEWKVRAKEFAERFLKLSDYHDEWVANPTGFPNVLKGTLPFLVFISAVRDVQEESKSVKSSPFGKLLQAILASVPQDRKETIEADLTKVAKSLNRIGGATRLEAVSDAEIKLNSYLKKFFDNCDLEIEFQTPAFSDLLASPRLFVNDGFRGGIENKGHGLQRATIFSILQSYASQAAINSDARSRTLILVVEEPELYMHPQAQRTIRRVFSEVAETDQVFFSTHSSFLVDVGAFEEIIRVEAKSVGLPEGRTSIESTIRQISMTDMIEDLAVRIPSTAGRTTPTSFHELYSHAYNPTRNEGFFAKKIILVEGNTEEYSLPIYADSLGIDLDREAISVVACGGKDSINRLYRVFNELGIPCYIIFDYDEGNTDPSIVRASRELLDFLNLPTVPPVSILITDRVSCFKKDWEAALRAEILDYATLTAGAASLLGSSSSKPLVARFIARTLAFRTPKIVPPSIEAILRKAVNVTWSSSCLRKRRAPAT